MVSVVKKEVDSISWYYSQSLRFQLITNILSKVVFIVILLAILIVVYIKSKIGDVIIREVNSFVYDRVALEMKIISEQMVTSFQTELFLLGTFVNEIGQLTMDTFNICATSGSCPYRAAYSVDINPGKIASTTIPNPQLPQVIDLTSSNLIYDRVTLTQADYELYESLDFDDDVTNLVTQYLSSNVRRIMIHRYTKSTTDYSWNFLKIYPCEYVDWNYIKTLHESNPTYALSESYNGSTILLKGPYQDRIGEFSENLTSLMVNIRRPALSLNKPEVFFQITIELLTSVISNLFTDNYYKPSVEIVICNKRGILIHSSDYWIKQTSSSASNYIYDQSITTYSGFDTENYQDFLEKRNLTTLWKRNKDEEFKEYLVYPVLIKSTFNVNNMTDYLLIGVPNLTIDFFSIIIYGEISDMYQVPEMIQAELNNQYNVVITFSAMTSIITVVLVVIGVYRASLKIDRPIRSMLKLCQFLNHKDAIFRQSVLERTKLKLQELEKNSEYQVKELVNSFQSLIDKIISRISVKQANIKSNIEYPLNEMEENFVKKARGKKIDFEWVPYINKIQNKTVFKS